MENLRDKLEQKVDKEYDNFIENFKSKGVDFLVENAYEVVTKQEIRDYLIFSRFDEKELKALIKSEDILDDLYSEWLHADGNLYESLEHVIQERVGEFKDKFDKEMQKKDKGAR